jgi:hypothetical protein
MITTDKQEWAENFKRNHSCASCPFVINEIDIGVGIQYHCEYVCQMEVSEILKEMEGYCV